jgi:hypothetical protein
MKTKLKSHFQVVHDSNDEVIRGEDVFQLNELVDPYRVTSFTHIDINKLNNILSTSGNTENYRHENDANKGR